MLTLDFAKPRNVVIDNLRGWAIFLVVWGHTIQCLGLGYEVFNDPIGKFIYTFHMPLFFFISGYFPKHIENDSWKTLLKSRIGKLLIPTLIWSTLGFILLFVISNDYCSIFIFFKDLVLSLIGSYWFIYILLMCIVFSKLSYSLSRFIKCNKWYVIATGAILLLLVPNFPIPFGSYMSSFKCFYPFFILGWLFKDKNVFSRISSTPRLYTAALLTGALLLLGLLFHKGAEWFVYSMPVNFLRGDSFIPLIVFLLFGIVGILFSYSIIKLLSDRFLMPVLSNLGRATLGIYFVQGIIFNVIFSSVVMLHIENMLLFFLIAILITSSCYAIVCAVRQSKFLSKIML